MNTKDWIKALAKEQGLTFKELSQKAGMSEKGLHNKFARDSLTVRDLVTLLSVLGKELTAIDKKPAEALLKAGQKTREGKTQGIRHKPL